MTLESLLMILVRWGHLLFGIGWIGMLYYFNFVQGGYFKAATPEALKDAKAKLAPSALWWFRWGAMFTFLTGLVLLHYVYGNGQLNGYIIVGATLATVMFLNVWLVIWPNQKIALGLVQGGDAAAAGAKAALASRHNVLFSGPMAFGMLAGPHFIGSAAGYGHPGLTLGGWLVLASIALLEANALFGKQGVLTTVRGVITSSVVYALVIIGLLEYL
ncbi:MAG: urate hydroxylase PuuD [Pseudohongiellaceae bacterium]|jgi:uncharacterized membrane protein